MDIKIATDKLDIEWDQDGGFFGKLRAGIYDEQGFQRVRDILASVVISSEQIDKRFVAVTWFIPTFMDWQRERVRGKGGDVNAVEHAQQVIIELLYKVLGVP